MDDIKAIGNAYLISEEERGKTKRDKRGFHMEEDIGKIKGMMFDNGFMFNIAPPGLGATYVEAIVEIKPLEAGRAESDLELDVRLDTMWKLGIFMNFLASAFLIGVGVKFGQLIPIAVGVAYFGLYMAYSYYNLTHYEKKMISLIETRMQGKLS